MAEAEESRAHEETTQPPAESGEKKTEETLPKSLVEQLIADRAKRAESSAISKLVEELGVESVDEMRQIISDYREAEAEVKDELDEWQERHGRLEKQYAETQQRLEELTGRYTTLLKRQALERALIEAGVKRSRLAHAIKHADLSAIELSEGGEASGAGEVAKAVKEEVPEFFEETRRGGIPPAPGGTNRSGLSHEEKLARSNLARLRF
ncbi:hypothetical protein [Rubrobacter calidifluminis]|uniref:phage scaffolding protein n=1 Tax=Rubrobacter calidifluminis TaxID=1392640 RepID=UPI00235EADFA|nr:hypothetical protein [Rubrobacter calidifluminis]